MDGFLLLKEINSPNDLRKLPVANLQKVADELRSFLISTVSKTSGHFASGLGVVELTVALHYVYDTPKDKLIWDVGHQAYPHKILTGRRDELETIRQKDGLHPFLWRKESEYDVFSTGHASTSISEALGIAIANRLLGKDEKVVAVIGDGALTGGVAFEALNHAGGLQENMLIIINDNEMSISESVGSLSKHFAMWLSSPSYAKIVASGQNVFSGLPLIKDLAKRAQEHIKGMVTPGTLFEEFGFNYVGPIDGHDLPTLVTVLRNMRELKGPQILHVATKKGKGYLPAEKNPTMYHGVPRFDPPKGVEVAAKTGQCSYSELFGRWLCEKASKDKKIVAITPAMCEGSGMTDFAQEYPDRYFDVAIAEQHAVLLGGALAAGGLRPVVAVYSTFLQRAYDQLIHDVAIQDVPVIIAIDRAGVVGPDGPTHQGVFDISFMRAIPNMVIMAPSNLQELWRMLNSAYNYPHPIAIRYPRGSASIDHLICDDACIDIGKGEVLVKGKKVCVIAWGPMSWVIMYYFKSKQADFTVVNMRSIKPLDLRLVEEMARTHDYIITYEDGYKSGGIGEEVATFVQTLPDNLCTVEVVALPDEFIEQAQVDEVYQEYGMDPQAIYQKAISLASKVECKEK